MLPTGPVFNIKYDRNATINCPLNEYCYIAPLYSPESTVSTTSSLKCKGVILHVPTKSKPIYTILYSNGTIEQHSEQKLIPENAPQIDSTATCPDWICNHAPVTLYLENMKTPKQGYLNHDSQSEW
eukprot:7967481-Ditylum_brightwellii.AAC.1